MSGDIRSGCPEPADHQLHSGASLKCKIRTDIASVISPLPESGCVSSGRNAGVQIAESAWRSAVDLSGRRLPLGALGGGSRIRAFAVSLGCSAWIAVGASTGLRAVVVSARLGYVVGAFGLSRLARADEPGFVGGDDGLGAVAYPEFRE